MKKIINMETAYGLSEDIVAREIEGELIIVPLTAGSGDTEDDLFTLNETGRAIWDRLDGKKSLKKVVDELNSEYDSPADKIETDVIGIVQELLRRNIVVPSPCV